MSDGKLDLVILKDSGILKMIDEFVKMKDGDYSEEDNIFHRQVKQVSIASKERDVTVAMMVSLLEACRQHLKLYLMH